MNPSCAGTRRDAQLARPGRLGSPRRKTSLHRRGARPGAWHLAPGELEDPDEQRLVEVDPWFRSARLAVSVGEVEFGVAGFVKEFDLLERICRPRSSSATPTEEEAHRELLMRAAAGLGVAAALTSSTTTGCRSDRRRTGTGTGRGQTLDRRVEVGPPGYLHPDATLPVRSARALSRFDPSCGSASGRAPLRFRLQDRDLHPA